MCSPFEIRAVRRAAFAFGLPAQSPVARSALLGSLVHPALELPNGGTVLREHGHGATPARQAVAVDAAEQAPDEGQGGGQGGGEGAGDVGGRV